MLPCSVIVQSTAPTLRAHHSVLSRSCNTTKNAPLSFQPLTHSSEFTNRSIPSIFCAPRTLCQKHRSAGPTCPTEFSANQLTLTESISFTDVPSNPFRILFFQNMYPPTPLESSCFTNTGHRWLQQVSQNSPAQFGEHAPTNSRPGPGSQATRHPNSSTGRQITRAHRGNSCPAAQGLLSWALFGYLLRPRRSGGGRVRLTDLKRFHPGGCKRQLLPWGIYELQKDLIFVCLARRRHAFRLQWFAGDLHLHY